ncbi:MAG: hypothetical protein Q7R71_01745 [bacterium]|nr:hypothetical protein [bacterium]
MEKRPSVSITTQETKNWKKDLEHILTPELGQKIMDKVIDINSDQEFAFSGLNENTVKGMKENYTKTVANVLRWGLLGKNMENLAGKEWALKQRESEKPTFVYFHIANHPFYQRFYVNADGTPLNDYLGGYPKFIFDHSEFSYDQHPKPHEMKKEEAKQLQRSYSVPQGGRESMMDYGFMVPYNVSVKYFKGVILETPNKAELNKVTKAMFDVYKTTPEKMLPIYDKEGGLLWPKQMSKKEVKELKSSN